MFELKVLVFVAESSVKVMKRVLVCGQHLGGVAVVSIAVLLDMGQDGDGQSGAP
ncbi:hypothetical protein [Streptomyces shenzhenensis]|uniref:hypothetical protein n=1 Tax=Streptomyces shenzhenensis TaxID=943815 RepID=UPI0033E46779